MEDVCIINNVYLDSNCSRVRDSTHTHMIRISSYYAKHMMHQSCVILLLPNVSKQVMSDTSRRKRPKGASLLVVVVVSLPGCSNDGTDVLYYNT